MPRTSRTSSAGASVGHRRTYVIDTSVLLADPLALAKFDEHAVVLPLAVIAELEAKRNHPDVGWLARQSLRELERLRVVHGSLTEPLPINDDGGTLRVEVNHIDASKLPTVLRNDSNDCRILAVAHHLASTGEDVTLVSKDLPLRLTASIIGLRADEYRREHAIDPSWSGFVELDVDPQAIDILHRTGVVDLPLPSDVGINTGVALHCGSQSALARQRADKQLHLVRGDHEIFGVRGRSAEQRIAIDLLRDETVGIVSLGGNAGTGKSVLALAAGLEAVLEQRRQRRVMVFRPLYPVGGQELGFLPGAEQEKMNPWGAAVFDAIGAICSQSVVDEVIDRRLLEILPLTHLRGRTLTDTFVIIDEAQNLERQVLLTALSRLGNNSRVVLTHDVAQRDNLRVGRHDGVVSVIEALRGHPLFGHVTLTRAERSPVAALVTDLLADSA